jgi:hypothetical protein
MRFRKQVKAMSFVALLLSILVGSVGATLWERRIRRSPISSLRHPRQA